MTAEYRSSRERIHESPGRTLSGRRWKYEPLPSALKFHQHVTTRYKGFSGPVGSGKSFAFCYEALFLCYQNPGLLGMMCAPTYPMLRDSTKRSFMEILEIEQIPYREHKSENCIEIRDTGSEILFRSLDDPERRRGPNVAWFGVDELTYCKPKAWSRLEGRLRHPDATRLCGFAAWTPKGYDAVYDRFIDQPPKDYWAVMAQPRENKYVADSGYYDRLESSYDERLFRQEVLGQYLPVHLGQVYFAFDRSVNVKPLTPNALVPICWTLDFNVNPMCSVICQIEDRASRTEQVLGLRMQTVNVLDEIALPNSNTQAAAEEFVRRMQPYLQHRNSLPVRIYGDPAGKARQSAGKSDWEIVHEIIRRDSRFEALYYVPSSHPRVKDRTNAMNGMLKSASGDTRLFVDPRCKELIRDLERVVWKTDAAGNTTGEIDKSDNARTHLSDALGYLVEEEFGLKQPIGYRPERLI